MKVLVLALLLGAAGLRDIFTDLKVTRAEARDYVYANFEEGTLRYPHSSFYQSMTGGQRAAAVNTIGDFVKAYMSSPAFAEQYRIDREVNRPVNGTDKIKAEIETTKAELARLEKEFADVKGDMKKVTDATLDLLRTKLKALQDPKDPNHALYATSVNGINPSNEKEFAKAMKEFEEDYPATPDLLVKKRLQQFLELTANIDFDAKLKKEGDVTVFVDPKFENQTYNWKLCFRSGRETVTAARAYATAWLKSLK